MSGILQMVFAATSGSGPINTVAPVVTGTAQVRQTLSCTQGTWVSPTPISGYAYQWQHGTTNIPGATSSTYTISYLYSGETIRCIVTATSSSGSTGFPSNASAAVAATTPLAPTIGTATSPTNTSGLVQFVPNSDNGGSVVTSYTATSSPGGITGTAAGTPITVNGLTTGTYYNFTVYATNSAGNSPSSGVSNDILPGASAPANTVAPSISGTAQAHQYLSSSTGSWTGIPTPTYSYQWQEAGGTNIPGETGSSIYLMGYNVGTVVRCRVTATNVGGSAIAYTAYSSTITANTPLAPYGVSASYTETPTPRVGVTFYPSDNGGSAVTQYTIKGRDAGGFVFTTQTTTSTNDVSVPFQYGADIYYTVTATNSIGTSTDSSPSNTLYITRPVVYNLLFMVAGGGAGGSNRAGGGGGGRVWDYDSSMYVGQVYTVSVGAGGTSVANANGGNGGSTTFTGMGVSISIAGGGGGGKIAVGGNSGGSGGGAGFPSTVGLSGGAASGSYGAGFAGADAYVTTGGGGGASETPYSPTGSGASGTGGSGGQGITFDNVIISMPVCGSGGGGGGGTTAGGPGGSNAGAGGKSGVAGGSAGPYYGGGGGGGGASTSIKGGNGGSGVFILMVPTADYTGVVTGAVVSTNAGYTIMEFYTSGTYTA